MSWEFDNSIPIYLQLVDRLKLNIISGKMNPGDKLSSVRDLAQETGVNPNTMQRALAELEREGLIYSVRTCGRFITQDAQLVKTTRENIAKEKMDEFFRSMLEMGYSEEEINKIILNKVKGDENE